MAKLLLKCALGGLIAAMVATSTADARRRHYFQGFFTRQDDGEERERRGEAEERAVPRPPAASFGAIIIELARGCREQAGELKHWPFERIAEAAAPDETQRRALDALRETTLAAAERLAADCPGVAVPSATAATLAARLDMVDGAIASVTAALEAVQPVLRDFYATLDDEQKARLYRGFGMGEPAVPAGMRARPRAAAEGSPGAGVPWAAVCERLAAALRDWPSRRIEREMRLSDPQRIALHELYAAALRAADQLGANCPAETALTPARRMQTLRARLLAVRTATTAVRPALARFQDALDSTQQQRFAQMN